MPQVLQAQLGFHIITAYQSPHVLLRFSEENSIVDVAMIVSL